MTIDRQVNLDGDYGAVRSDRNGILSHDLADSSIDGVRRKGGAKDVMPIEYGGLRDQPQERQPRHLGVAETAKNQFVNGGCKSVSREGITKSSQANLEHLYPRAAPIGKLAPKFESGDEMVGKICWIVPVGGPDTDWWLRFVVNEDVSKRMTKPANVFLSINDEPFKFFKQAETHEREIRFKFTKEEYARISKLLHPRVHVNVEFQGDLEMQALPY